MIRIPIQLSFPWWQRAGEGFVCSSSLGIVPTEERRCLEWLLNWSPGLLGETGVLLTPAGTLGTLSGPSATRFVFPVHLKYKATCFFLQQAAVGRMVPAFKIFADSRPAGAGLCPSSTWEMSCDRPEQICCRHQPCQSVLQHCWCPSPHRLSVVGDTVCPDQAKWSHCQNKWAQAETVG